LLSRAYIARKNIPVEEKHILSNNFWAFNMIVVIVIIIAQVSNVFLANDYSDGILVFGIVAIIFCMTIFQIMNEQSHSTEQ